MPDREQMTVGDLRRALEGVPDDLPVWVEAEAVVDGEVDTLHAPVEGASRRDAGLGRFFSGPDVAHFRIFANGVPEGTCRSCFRTGGRHESFCKPDEETEDA